MLCLNWTWGDGGADSRINTGTNEPTGQPTATTAGEAGLILTTTAPWGTVFASVDDFRLRVAKTRPGAVSGRNCGILAPFGKAAAARAGRHCP